MTRIRYQRIGVVAGTLLIAVVEWLLFELIRTPYRPPNDMATLLGQEKYGVVGFMGVLLAVWIGTVLWLALSSRFTMRDYPAFRALLGVLLAVGGYLLRNPLWPVSPHRPDFEMTAERDGE
jgi:hypothetical protein